jgi:DNA-binding LacI/PurR family transcriptional regulator
MLEGSKPVTLKMLSEHLGLSKTTISMVLNNAPGAKTIAPATRQRVQDAAARFQYRSNLHAQLLGTRQRGSLEGDVSAERDDASFGSVKEQARRVYELELENARLKRLVAELRLDKAILKGVG